MSHHASFFWTLRERQSRRDAISLTLHTYLYTRLRDMRMCEVFLRTQNGVKNVFFLPPASHVYNWLCIERVCACDDKVRRVQTKLSRIFLQRFIYLILITYGLCTNYKPLFAFIYCSYQMLQFEVVKCESVQRRNVDFVYTGRTYFM